MKILGVIAIIWLACLAIGAAFSIIGKIIWVAVLLTVIAGVWGFVSRDQGGGP